MRRLLVIATACLLTACGTTVQAPPVSAPGGELTTPASGTQPSSTSTTTSAPQGGMPSTTGVSPGTDPTTVQQPDGTPIAGGPSGRPPATGPLQIGVLDASSPAGAISALGGSSNLGVDPSAVTKAFLRYYNAHGGMAGRRLVPVEVTINPTSTSYETDLAAACATFTQDNHVAVVMSQTGNLFSSSHEQCLTKAGVVNVEASSSGPDEVGMRSFPSLLTVSTPTVDRRLRALLDGLLGAKLTKRGDLVGVVVEGCPENDRAYQRTLAPLAKAAGVTLERRDVDCVHGFGDAGSVTAQTQATVLPLRSAGVDRVLFVSSFETALLQAFEGQAHSQGWSVPYGLTSASFIAANASMYQPDQLARMDGVGWIPIGDTTGLTTTGPGKTCLQRASSQGVTATSQADQLFVLQICDLFAVLDQTLTASHGYPDRASLFNALPLVSKGFQSAWLLGGRLQLAPDRRDAPTASAVFRYGTDCSCFRYRTAARSMR